MKTFPPRIHVLLAREAPLGVVIRRGPSKRVATFLWDRRHDEFSLGQWLKGRIYERRSDLSSDGKYLIYFAMNGKWRSETQGSWTAISRAPYLKALALFAQARPENASQRWPWSRNTPQNAASKRVSEGPLPCRFFERFAELVGLVALGLW
jgi:hypothetical protein